MYKWNMVFNLIMDLKNAYLSKVDKKEYEIDYSFPEKYGNIVEYWAKQVNDPPYKYFLQKVHINQQNHIIYIQCIEQNNNNSWGDYHKWYSNCHGLAIDIYNNSIVGSSLEFQQSLDLIGVTSNGKNKYIVTTDVVNCPLNDCRIWSLIDTQVNLKAMVEDWWAYTFFFKWSNNQLILQNVQNRYTGERGTNKTLKTFELLYNIPIQDLNTNKEE